MGGKLPNENEYTHPCLESADRTVYYCCLAASILGEMLEEIFVGMLDEMIVEKLGEMVDEMAKYRVKCWMLGHTVEDMLGQMVIEKLSEMEDGMLGQMMDEMLSHIGG